MNKVNKHHGLVCHSCVTDDNIGILIYSARVGASKHANAFITHDLMLP